MSYERRSEVRGRKSDRAPSSGSLISDLRHLNSVFEDAYLPATILPKADLGGLSILEVVGFGL